MDAIRFARPRPDVRREESRIEATTATPAGTIDIYVRGTGGPFATSADAWIVAGLMPSLRRGWDVHVSGGLSRRLAENVARIQEYCHARDERFGSGAATFDVAPAAPLATGRGVGCFFSGGVDSFYSLLKHELEITHLIFVHGFDIRLEDRALYARSLDGVRRVCAAFGKSLIEIETNLRSFSDPLIDWDDYHGAAGAFVAHLLSTHLRKVFFACGMTYDEWKPFGTNPFLLSLWSSEAMEFVGDGYEARRLQKIARVAESTVAMDVLRVCWENPEGAYNCGRCEKCLRTMVGLRMAGMLERCSAFDRTLNLDALARRPYVFANPVVRRCWTEIQAELNRRGNDPELGHAVAAFLAQDGGDEPGSSRGSATAPGKPVWQRVRWRGRTRRGPGAL